MPQLNLYVNDELADLIRREADAADMSVSRYLAELIRREVSGDWPEGFFDDVVGCWHGEPLERAPQGVTEDRVQLEPGR